MKVSIPPNGDKSVANFIVSFHACKRLILIELMGCVHTHQRMHAIERCDSSSHDQNVVKKVGEFF